MRNYIFLTLMVFACNKFLLGQNQIKIYSEKSNAYCNNLKNVLKQHNYKFKVIENPNQFDDQNLYIIFDVLSLKMQKLPKYYIAYQTCELNQFNITPHNLSTLSAAIAVWDYDLENINKYKNRIKNYYYVPKNFEFFSALLLPFSLPSNTLNIYKKILNYSNIFDSDISSHLPIMFAHCILSKPTVIVEAGVGPGQSTVALHEASKYFNAFLLGVDINEECRKVYKSLGNASFFHIKSENFPAYYLNHKVFKQKIDIVFIDTSHRHDHTFQEIEGFEPLMGKGGMFMFHDSNVTPLDNNTHYIRLNKTIGYAEGNPRGVTSAIKEYFSIEFDESKYCCQKFVRKDNSWELIHYPYCNGLTLLRKLN